MNDLVYLSADRFPLVRDIGWNQTTSMYTHPDRQLDYDVFIFVTKGEMQIIEEEKEYIVNAGEHLFLKRGLHHWGLPRTPDGTSWYWIHFNVAIEDEGTYKDYSPLPELGFYYPDYYQYRFSLPKYGTSPLHLSLEARLKLLMDQYQHPKEHQMTRNSLKVYELFMDLHTLWKQRTHDNIGGKLEGTVRRVMTYLVQHCGEEFVGKQLSLHMVMNYSYLSAAFKQVTGYTIIETHTKLRLNKAIELMRTTSWNVSEISEALGFPNPYYFSRVFKKVLGEAPSSYMKHLYRN
ncbi:AraC family transcriptional regulator [Paenibacillus sp. FA6]|uniref:AraC family transcriptional regulator n=1 Tax=Paenibacillus sp. FA6 TaxID=3413029 RepID=UPI003F65A880